MSDLTPDPILSNPNAFSPIHPHEPTIPPTFDDEGRCLICVLLVERDEWRKRVAELEAERDELAQQVMTVQVGDEYTLGHEHGSAVAVKYRDRAKTAEKRIADLETVLAAASNPTHPTEGP